MFVTHFGAAAVLTRGTQGLNGETGPVWRMGAIWD
jgi:hypothetical protein